MAAGDPEPTPALAPGAGSRPPGVPFRRALALWWRIGLISFGGPAGQIALLHTELVERRRWIAPERFDRALNLCMLLPGPEAQQLATWCGWSLHGVRGGIAAGALFVLPSALLLWALAWMHATLGHVPQVASVLGAFQPAVVAILAAALLALGRRALGTGFLAGLALAALLGIAFLGVPFPAIVLGAGALGFAVGRLRPAWLRAPAAGHGARAAEPTAGAARPHSGRSGLLRDLLVSGVCLVLWFAPLLLLAQLFGRDSVYVDEGIFFSKAAMVTFGGAYAVLPYVAEHAVEVHGWVRPDDVMAALALAETTPGPLIMMTQFIGFLGGWNDPGALSPLASATLAAAITTWVTFLPCFLWIFLLAPRMERLTDRPALAHALRAITAAVVGVIVHLGLWFAAHTFHTEAEGWRPAPIALALVAFGLLRFAKLPLHWLIALAALVGLAASYIHPGLF